MAEQTTKSAGDLAPPSGLRYLLFAGGAVLLPLALIVLVETGLRFAGVASDQIDVFIPVDESGTHLALNPDYVTRYFNGFIPGVAYTPFQASKGPNTYRVFVLGGSTTAGFPYRYYNGFPDRLATELEARRFGQRIEVVNLGMSAVNSYTVLDLARAVRDYDPDAVLVYAGHNEFYGALGTGSNEGGLIGMPWLKRLVIRLRRTVLFTLAESLFRDPPAPTTSERTLMARVVREADIHFEGPVFNQAIEQYRNNMSDALGDLVDADIPVYIGTLVSNLADQAPLSENRAALDAFEEGQRLLAAGDVDAARQSLVLSRELDGMRFRAPAALNRWIREEAPQLGAVVVDLEPLFQEASSRGVEGNELFTDHLHPNALGYQIMASAFGQHIGDSPTPLTAFPDRSLDDLDRAHADLLIKRLLGDYPFTKNASDAQVTRAYDALLREAITRGPADSIATLIVRGSYLFPDAQQALSEILRVRGDTLAALHSYRSLLAWQPFNQTLQNRVIEFGLQSPSADLITDRIALEVASREANMFSLNALAATRLRMGLTADARTVLSRAESVDSLDQTMLFNTARVLVQLGDTLQAREYFGRYQAARGR